VLKAAKRLRAAAPRWFLMLVSNRDGNDPAVTFRVVPLANETGVLDMHAFVATYRNDEADTLRFFIA